MKIINYLGLNQHPIYFRFQQNRTETFKEVYHAHQGMEILYIHEGEGHAVIDQQIIPIRPRIMLFFKPYQLHRVQIYTSQKQAYVRSMFLFEPLILQKYMSTFSECAELLRSLTYDNHPSQVVEEFDQEGLISLMRFFEQRLVEVQPSELQEQQALFLISLLSMLGSAMKLGATNMKTTHPSVTEQIMAWIDLHYMEPFELERLASSVHLSPVHVSALFRKHMGYSITEHLTARRIREACYLLKKSNLSVKEIGESVGLTNASYFSQCFKKNVGVTPYQYKNINPPI